MTKENRLRGRTQSEAANAISDIRYSALVAAIVLAACLAGILLRPPGLLSSFWGANAILLGVLLRTPNWVTPATWLGSILAYILADLATGSPLPKTAILTAANVAGVGTALLTARKIALDANLDQPNSTTGLVLATGAGSLAAGCVGAVANPLIFAEGALDGFVFWSVTEFANYVAILPLVLTLPRLLSAWRGRLPIDHAPVRLQSFIPLLTFIASSISAAAIGGVSALAIPIPALIWCALVYSVPGTSLMSFVYAMTTLVLATLGIISIGFPIRSHVDLISLRLAVSLIALTPLAVAAAVAAYRSALSEASLARKAAEDAMSARALLLATMTHELRTPLNAIVGLASVMEMEPVGALGKPEHHEFVAHIRQGGLHLSELITDLLDTAKVEAGESRLTLVLTPSRSLIEQSFRLVAGLAMQRKVRIVRSEGAWPEVVADPRAIKQVLINVLSNAIRFSPAGSEVLVSGCVKGGRLFISISDIGAGIPAEDMVRLGRPYQQAASTAKGGQGTGLGLTLSMNLVRAHGGALQLASKVGVGTTVTFDLSVGDTVSADRFPKTETASPRS